MPATASFKKRKTKLGAAAKRRKKPTLTMTGVSAKNTLTSGPGSQRFGKRYRIARKAGGQYIHVYGSGKNAKRVGITRATAKSLGYDVTAPAKRARKRANKSKPKAPLRGAGPGELITNHRRRAAKRHADQQRQSDYVSAG